MRGEIRTVIQFGFTSFVQRCNRSMQCGHFTFGFAGNQSLMKGTDEIQVERVKQVVCLSVCLDMFKNSVRVPH